MAILYKVFQSVLESKDKKKLFHPRVVYTANASIGQIAKEVAGYSSLSAGDVKNTIDNLVTVVSQHLQSSETVTLEGLGAFRLVMKSNGNGVATPEEVSDSQASVTARFQPAFTCNANGTVSTRSLVTGVKCMRFELEKGAGGSGGGSQSGGGDGGGEAPDPTA